MLIRLGNLKRNYYLSLIYVHEVAMYPSAENQTASTARMQMLIECFNAGKNYLDTAIAVPIEEMVNWTFSDWMCTNYAVVTSRRSAIMLDSVYRSDDSKWRGLWMDECCDNLSARAKTMQTLSGPHPNQYFEKFVTEWTGVKLRHHQDVQFTSTPDMTNDSSTQQVAPYVDPFSDINMESISWFNFGFEGSFDGNVVL